MTDDAGSKRSGGETDFAAANRSYQAALSLYVYEGNLTWSRFNVMLVGQSLVLAGLLASLNGSNPPLLIVALLSGVGLFLTVLWHRITSIGFATCKHYYWLLLDLEERYLSHPANVVTRTAARPATTYHFGGADHSLPQPLAKDLFGIRGFAMAMICMFGIAHLALLVFAVHGLRQVAQIVV